MGGVWFSKLSYWATIKNPFCFLERVYKYRLNEKLAVVPLLCPAILQADVLVVLPLSLKRKILILI